MRRREHRLVASTLLLSVALSGAAAAQDRPGGTPAAQATWWLARSREHESHGDYAAAMRDVEHAREVVNAVADKSLCGEVWCQLAWVLWRRADYAGGLIAASTARGLIEPLGPSALLVRVLTVEAAIHQARSELDVALALDLDALRVSMQLGDEVAVARAHNNIGLVYWDLGRHEDARAELLQALQVHERRGPRGNLGNTLCNLGLVLIELERPDQALPYLERALQLDVEDGNLYGQAKCYSNLGGAHEKLGQVEQALEQHLQALALREQIGDKEGIVRSRGAVAEVRLRRGEAKVAADLLQQALALAAEIGDRRDEAELQRSLASAREALGDHVGALAAFRRYHDGIEVLTGTETRRRVSELEKRFDGESSAREFAAVEALSASRAETLRWMVVGSSLLVGCLGLLGAGRVRRARGQRALAESERRYRTLFQTSVVPTLLIDVATRQVLERNDPAKEGAAVADDAPVALDELEPAWLRESLHAALDDAAGDQLAVDDSVVEPGGGVRWLEVRGRQVAVAGRSCWLVTVRDTSAARALEAARTLEAKMESLGVLAGGIAHDFNNALTAIGGNLSLAREALPSELPALLVSAEQATLAARRLSTRLLSFARGGEPVRAAVDVGALVRDAVERTRAQAVTEVELRVEPDLSGASLDAAQLAQVVTQLVRNAQQAMEDRGTVEVQVRNWAGAADDPAAPGGSMFVRIDVADRGPGVPAAIRDRILDPFFSTRPGGTGLGLATAYAICRRHGGALAFEARDGGGEVFSAWFPAAPRPVVLPSVAPSATGPRPRAAGAALVLEDEAPIQHVLRGMLQRWGFTVEVVADGRAAVQLYRERLTRGAPFEFAIMDLTIPGGVGGKQAMAEIRALDPSARAIVASGYCDDLTMAHCREAGFAAALAKPFLKDELARAILEVQGVAAESD